MFLFKTLLANDRQQAIPAEIGTINIPILVFNNVTDVMVERIKTTVSTDSIIEVSVLYLL